MFQELAMQTETRVGFGYDVHRFGPNTYEQGLVRLCGVDIPHDQALEGHSDADVGMHALCDAIYGALADGDIGAHFPPSDPQWKGAESQVFLRHAASLIAKTGGRLVNCDVTLVCERPKIGPHRPAMRAALAELLGVVVARVAVKATTSEGLGFTGRQEGIAAHAVVSIEVPKSNDEEAAEAEALLAGGLLE